MCLSMCLFSVVYPDRNKTYEQMVSDQSLDDIATYATGAGPWKVRESWGAGKQGSSRIQHDLANTQTPGLFALASAV